MPAVPKARTQAKPSLGYSECLTRKAEKDYGCIFENPLALEGSMGRRKIDCGSNRSNEARSERNGRSLELLSQGTDLQKVRLRRANLLPEQQQLFHRIEGKEITISKQSVKLKTGRNGCNPASSTRRPCRRKLSLDLMAKAATPTGFLTSTHPSMSPNATKIPLLDDCEMYSTDHSNSDEDCLEFNLAEDILLRSGKEHYEQGVAGCCTPVCDILSSSMCSPVSEVGSLSLKSLAGLDNLVKDRSDGLELGTLDDSNAGSFRSTDARDEAYCIYPGWSLWATREHSYKSMSHDSAPCLRRFSSVKSLRFSIDQHAEEQYHSLCSEASSSRISRSANGKAVVRSLEPSFRKAGLFTAKVYQSVASSRKCSISASAAFEEAKLPLLKSQRTARKRPVTFLTEGLKSLASKGLSATGFSFPSVIPLTGCSIPKFDQKHLLKPEKLLPEKQSKKLLNQRGGPNEPEIETSHLNGYMQRIFKHGVTSYSFWMDDFDEVFVAKAESADGECKCFTFYSCKGKEKGGWRHWQKLGKPIVNLVATMNFSRSVYAEVDCQGEIMHYMDSEFSLLDERVQKKQFSATMLQKIRQSSTCYTKLNKPLLKAYFRTLWNNPLVHSDYEAGIKFRKELAAMVVRVPLQVKKDSSYVEASKNVRRPLERFLRSRQQEQRTVTETLWGSIVGNASETITVILPAGDHGHPTYGLEGPRPLVERWRSGGLCDCGSWDLGCGMAILSKDSGPAIEEDKLPLNILVEGRKQKVVAMSLAPCQDGLFRVSYQEPMLSLQAFATAVAILHSKFSSAENKGYRSQERQTKLPCNLTTRHKENSRRTSMSCHPNPPLSPIDRL